VKLVLEELSPLQQDEAFARGELDLGFTRPLSKEQLALFHTRLLYKEPLLVAMPDHCAPAGKRVALKSFDGKPLILFHRRGAPGLYDNITALCNEAGFIPRIEHEPNMMQTVLSLVASEAGAAIVPACVSNLRADGVKLLRTVPDHTRVELIAVWPKRNPSVVLQSFLDLIKDRADDILAKAKTHIP
jgi:DNA-binding transcriptional LysR family regulator